MSNAVDRRVVEMQFDNRDFENNVKDSIESLDELKKSLELEESAKELKAFEKTANNFSLDSLASAAEAVTSKFSILGTIGDQVIRRLTDAAMNAVGKMKNFIESLTIQPISTGFAEYETQINAIQTIMSNTRDSLTKQGYSDAERLEIVNDRLDQLNHYADKTIYNFTEMTRNIGTFTAAGVELDTAVSSIQGIANLAAVSGSTSQQASTAMYQLSQAISTGTVKLMDWNSVVNAGMGGELFQKALIRTAKAMGVTGDKAIEMFNNLEAGKTSFRESLSSGWLTSDILTTTLEQFSWDFEQMAKDMGYTAENMEEGIARAMEAKKGELLAQGYTSEEADEIMRLAQDATDAATKVKTFTQLFDTLKEAAQSGWTQTWEYIVGDFEEAKEMLTNISNFFGGIIDGSSEARNTIFKEWHDAGGRDMLWNFDENEGPLGAFWNLAYSIQNIVSMIREEFEKVFPPATSDTLLNFTSKIQEATAKFKEWTESSEGMEKVRHIVAGIAAVFDIVKTAIGHAWENIKKLIGLATPAAGGFLGMAASVGDWLVKMRDSIKTSEGVQTFLKRLSAATEAVRGVVVSALKSVRAWISKLWAKIKDSGILTKIGQGISDFVGKIPDAIAKLKTWVKSIVEYVKNSETLQKVWAKIKEFFSTGVDAVSDFGKRLGTALKNFFTKDVSGEETLWGKLKARLSAFGSAFSDWFGTVKETVTKVWGQIRDFLSNFFTNTVPNFFNSAVSGAGGIISKIQSVDWGKIIKTALGIYAGIKVLSSLGGLKSIGKGLKDMAGGLKDMAEGIMDVAKNGIEITHKNKDSLGNTLLKIAAAIGILVASIYVLSTMKTEDVVTGLAVITSIAVELLAVSALFGKISASGKDILMIAASLLLLALPIKILGSMDTETALKGVIDIGVILTELAIFMRLAGKGFTAKTAFISLAIALNLMVLAVKNLAKLDTGTMAKALISMGVLILEMSIFVKKTSGLKKAGGLITMAIAINLLVVAVKRLGRMKTEKLAKGVLGLSGIMIAFGVMAKMTKGMKLGSSIVTLLTMAGTMLIFVEMFKQIDGMNTDDMVKFALSFSATMLAMSVAMKIISTIPISGALTGLAAFAVLIAGVGALVVGLGWLQSQWGGMTGFLESGGDVLGQLGRAIGKFVGGIGEGVLEGLGNGLTSYTESLDGLSEKTDQADTDAAIAVAMSLNRIKDTISPDSLGDWILALFGQKTAFERFADAFKPFGDGMRAYAEAISGFTTLVTTGENNAVIAAATGISGVAAVVPSMNTFWDNLCGLPTDFSAFIESIGPFGDGMRAYAEAISGFTTLVTTGENNAVIAAATGISGVAAVVPSMNTFWDNLCGLPTDFSAFIESIGPFGDGMRAYAEAISGFTTLVTAEENNAVIAAATGIAGLAAVVPSMNTFWDNLCGLPTDFSAFIESIGPFGTAMKAYATEISGFSDVLDEKDNEAAISAVTGIKDFAETLDPSGTIWDSIDRAVSKGSKIDTLLTYAGTLRQLGEDLKIFSDSMKNVNTDDVDYATTVFGVFQNFVADLEDSGAAWQEIWEFIGTGDKFNTLNTASAAMATFGKNFKTFSEGIEEADKSLINFTNAKEMFEAFATFNDGLTEENGGYSGWDGGILSAQSIISQLGSQIYQLQCSLDGVKYEDINAVANLVSSIASLAQAVSLLPETSVEPIQGFLNQFSEITIPKFDDEGMESAKAFIANLTDGIEDGNAILAIATAISSLSDEGTSAAEGTYDAWYSSGQYLSAGLGAGISSMAKSIRTAAVTVASGAINSIRMTWSVHSPSKVGADLGMYFDLGIAQGLNRYAKVVSGNAADMGKKVVDSASMMLRGVDGSIFDNIDPNPTIRPVVDLTNVQNGVNAINGMFDLSNTQAVGLFRGMNLTRGINSLNLEGGRITGTLTDKNIVSNLEGLQNKIEELGQAVTNMKLVLDSGELVGATSTKIDNSLGILAMRRGRGN